MFPFAVDGLWAAWTPWSTCSKPCGAGLQFKSRFCQYEADKPHGKKCEGNEFAMANCTSGLCAGRNRFTHLCLDFYGTESKYSFDIFNVTVALMRHIK